MVLFVISTVILHGILFRIDVILTILPYIVKLIYGICPLVYGGID
ncbi:hypothetical protein [Ehrlichia minasensis]|nr:hypothetical protein [Ehrlichia minasensis]